MPILCYVLLVHDCVIGIMGLISGIEEGLVFAFATKGWHMYFGVALSAIRSKTHDYIVYFKVFCLVGAMVPPPPPSYPSVCQPASLERSSPWLAPYLHCSEWPWSTPTLRYTSWLLVKLFWNIQPHLFQLYNLTLNGFLGASYCLGAAFEGVNLIGFCIVYYFIWKNEKKFGPLGTRDEGNGKMS